MNTTRVYIKKRPVKIGFLIEEGNIDDLVEIAEINTLLWGGIYNPIIPINNSERLGEKLIKTFEVDTVISLKKDNIKINDFIKNKGYLKVGFELDGVFLDKSSTIFNYVDIRHLIYHIWDKIKNNNKSNYYIVNWVKADPLNKLFSIDFGHLNTEIFDDIKGMYLSDLSAKEININCGEVLCEDLEMPFNPIILTCKGLHKTYKNTYKYAPYNLGFYFGNENSFIDLLNYWNIRACGYNIMFLPENHLERYKNIIFKRIKRLNESITELRGIHNRIDIYYRNEKEDEIKKLFNDFNSKQELIYIKCNNEIWNGLNLKPVEYYFSEEAKLGIIEKAYNNLNIDIHIDEKIFKATHHIGLNQKYVVSVNTYLNDIDFPDYTLNIPNIPQLNKYFTRNISWSTCDIRGKGNSIDIITELNNDFFTLKPIMKFELIKEIFKNIGFDAEYSQAGIITKNIIEKFGGIQSCRVFKIRGVRDLLNSLTKDDFVTSNYINKKIILEGQFKEYEDLYIEPRKNSKLTKEDVFNLLLKKNVLIPGFELICEKCNQKNWNSVNELKEIWRCNYCNSTNRIILQLKTKAHLQLRYRKSGLFSKDNNQEGAIPVILTLIQLNSVLHSLQSFIFTTSLNLTNNLFKREIDFCLLNTNKYDGEIEIGIAESKSEGGNIDIEDIEFMKLVRDKFQENNIECYLIFSKTSDQFTFDEIKLFEEELYKRDVPFILFTNKELEPYRPYDKYPKNKKINKFVFSLKDMAQNTSSIFKANTNINP